jgi:hypothetical protein
MIRSWIPGFIVLLVLAGCGGGTAQPPERMTEQEKANAALSIGDISAKAEDALSQARQKEWSLYAPRKLDELEKSVAKVRDATERGNRKRATEELMRTEKIMAEGQAVVATVRTELSEELLMRARLRELKADEAYPKEYEQVATKMRDLIVKAGEAKPEQFLKEKQTLNARMFALEVKVVRFRALNDVEIMLGEAKKKGAERLAPLTLGEAVTSFQAADAFIAQNPRDAKGVAEQAGVATFAVKHLVQVMDTVQARMLQKATTEQVVREEEARLLDLTKALGQPDLRDRAPTEQVGALLDAIKARTETIVAPGAAPKAPERAQQEFAAEKNQVLKLQDELAAARKENENLRGQTALVEAMKFQMADLERNKAELVRENERLRLESGGTASVSNEADAKMPSR